MSSNPEKNNKSTAAPQPANNNASEQNSALTVELSPMAASADMEGKSSALTTGPLDNVHKSPSQTTVNSSDATVLQNRRNKRQENSAAHSSSTEVFTSQNALNNEVIIVDNELIDGYIPVQLGNYQIIEDLGCGGMGKIFLALDVNLDRKAAIKILLPKFQYTEVQERFIVEAKASAKLHHENIVTIYSYGETNDLPYFAMEYIPGSNLKKIVEKSGVLSIEETLSYAIQIASALEHINEKGIVHRDIKPSNIIVTDNGTVKVIDLGLAKDFIQQQDDELTKAGVTLGTFDYISPEQSRDPRKVDIRSDIYSLGCTMFFMLIGKPPFADKKHNDKIKSHRSDTTPNLRPLRSDIPVELEDIVMRCMEKDPDLRYQTPLELSKDLYTAAKEQGMQPSWYSISKWYLPTKSQLTKWKDRLAWTIPFFALVIILLVLNCFWQPDQRQSEFLPESPSLKRNDSTVNSNGRTAPIFGTTVKKGKVLDVDRSVQAFPPTPEEPTPNESPAIQPPVVAEEQTPVPDSASPTDSQPVPPTPASPKVAQPVRKSGAAAVVQKEQILPDSNPDNDSQKNALPGNSNQRNIIHSVKLETD